jgi:ABC-2 type transport system ATP-binding protein
MEMIEASDLRKSYKRVRGLDGFSLRVETGEIVGLVGPNGAGKTSLIKILATLLPLDAGTARIGNWNVKTNPAQVRAAMGYLPDVAGIYQDLRIIEFLEFFADAYHLQPGKREEAIEQALLTSGLSDRREEYVEHLSLGWKQRLQLAKTLIHGPKVLLLDEPASGLDPLARMAFREQLKKLRAEGITILVSSHILADLEDVCSRVIFISEGKNVAEPQGIATAQAARKPGAIHCAIEFQENEKAGDLARSLAGINVLEATKTLLRAEVEGGEQGAAKLLRELLEAGVIVLHFDTKLNDLEERYVRTFRGTGGGPTQ